MLKPASARSSTFAGVWRAGLQMGLIGGAVAAAIALEGMLQAFATRSIISGWLTLGQALLLMTFFGTGYLAIRRSQPVEGGVAPLRPSAALACAALAGIVAALIPVALIGLGSILRLGDVLINATEQMYGLLTFGLDKVPGSLVLVVIGLVCGFLAGGLFLLRADRRRALVTGLIVVLLLGVLQDLVRVTLSEGPLALLRGVYMLLYSTNGLYLGGALVLFVVVAGLSYYGARWRQRPAGMPNRIPQARNMWGRWALLGAGVFVLLILPWVLGLYLSEVLNQVGLFLLMGLGLNIVVGYAGMLDLGYVAFYAIGAYTVGVFTSSELSTGVLHNWWLAMPLAILAAVSAGVVLGIPVLKMRGDYLAIVTLGFGEIIRLLVLSDFLKPFLGGASGIQRILTPNIGPLQVNWGPQTFYYLFLGGCLLVGFVAIRLKHSRLGRAWAAVREDEDVAQAMGIDLVTTKLMAFGTGAAFGGLSGAIFAAKLTSAYPQSFNFLVSVQVVSLIIIGGMGSIPGVAVGALALIGLPELLREVGDYRYLFYGLALVVMMLVRPEGLWPEAARQRELHTSGEEAAIPAPAPLPAQPDQ